MTGTVKALFLVGGLGVAGGGTAIGWRPVKMLIEVHDKVRDMNITSEQKREIHGILKSHRTEARAAADRLWDARLAVHEAARQEPLDEALVRLRAQQAGAVAGDLALLRARVRSEVRGVLSDAQREQAEALHALVLKDLEELRELARAHVDAHLEAD